MRKRDAGRIRDLNDAFRRTFCGGRIMLTAGVAALGEQEQVAILDAVRTFADFDGDNDPHGEHDFGSFEQADQDYFWKIDYYDLACVYGSADPADPTVTTRVLTIMRADEY
jgi:hypothetical protein